MPPQSAYVAFDTYDNMQRALNDLASGVLHNKLFIKAMISDRPLQAQLQAVKQANQGFKSLFIKNLPDLNTKEEVLPLFKQWAPNINFKQDKKQNKKFAFVNFNNFEDAAAALEMYSSRPHFFKDGQRLFISRNDKPTQKAQQPMICIELEPVPSYLQKPQLQLMLSFLNP